MEKDGGSIILEYKNDALVGSTIEKLFSSKLRGASYATSKIRNKKGKLKSWDRGFDSDDKQGWGAEKMCIFNNWEKK